MHARVHTHSHTNIHTKLTHHIPQHRFATSFWPNLKFIFAESFLLSKLTNVSKVLHSISFCLSLGWPCVCLSNQSRAQFSLRDNGARTWTGWSTEKLQSADADLGRLTSDSVSSFLLLTVCLSVRLSLFLSLSLSLSHRITLKHFAYRLQVSSTFSSSSIYEHV